MSTDRKARKERIGKGVYSLQEAGTAAFVLDFLKINIFHVLFEVLFAVLLINLMVFYSSSESNIPLSEFFGRVLFTCGIIYLLITIFFLFIVVQVAMSHIEGKNIKEGELQHADLQQNEEALKANLQKKETYEKAIRKSIYYGLFAHIVMGILSAVFPSFFTGVREMRSDFWYRFQIGSAIILFGIGGFILSWLRYKRINWIEVIKNNANGSEKPTAAEEYDQYINTLSSTLKSAVAQVIISCVIVGIFAKVFLTLAPVSNDFDYYNLILALVFVIISTYVTIVYKKEFFSHEMPCFSITPCKKPDRNEDGDPK